MTIELALLVAFAALALALWALNEQAGLRRRLRALERRLADTTPADARAPAEARPDPAAKVDGDLTWALTPTSEPLAHERDPIGDPTPAAPPPPSVEAALGLTWAARIGALLLLAGVVFFFKVALERGWLGPWAIVSTACGSGVLALALAGALRHRVTATFFHVMAGIGLAIIIASAWVAHQLYGLVEAEPAFIVLVVIVTLGGALAAVMDSEPVLTIALLAGFGLPVALGAPLQGSAFQVAYPLLLAAASVTVAAPRTWRWALAAAGLAVPVLAHGAPGGIPAAWVGVAACAYGAAALLLRRVRPAHGVGVAWVLTGSAGLGLAAWGSGTEAPVVWALLVGVWGALHVADAALASTRAERASQEAEAIIVLVPLTGLAIIVAAHGGTALGADWLLAAAAPISASLWACAVWRGVPLASAAGIAAILATAGCAGAVLEGEARFAAWGLIAGLGALVGGWRSHAGMLQAALTLVALAAALSGLEDGTGWAGRVAAAAAAYVIAAAGTRHTWEVGRTARFGAHALVAVVLVVDLAGVDTALIGTLLLGGWGSTVLAWGFYRRRRIDRWFGLVLWGVTLLKLVSVDLFSLDLVGRTVILVVVGALLLASAFLYARFGARLRELFEDPGQKS